jgi:hypothetical protein
MRTCPVADNPEVAGKFTLFPMFTVDILGIHVSYI